MNDNNGWIGVDLDGTLAHYTSWKEQGNNLGAPIKPMVNRVRQWLAEGIDVRIFTARSGQDEMIQDWLLKAGLPRLRITNQKDPAMMALWDDRCVQVGHNTGEPVSVVDIANTWAPRQL